jgi:hypothetical protein
MGPQAVLAHPAAYVRSSICKKETLRKKCWFGSKTKEKQNPETKQRVKNKKL